jgi:poly(A) polymerase
MTLDRLADVLAEVAPLAARFTAAGFRIHLVGGIVRDQLLDRPLDSESDIDLTTDAVPEEIKKVIAGWADAVWDQGERFGTIGCSAAGRQYEITTHRAEFYEPDSRKPEVAFSGDIEADLSRRDFTVNAMAIEVPSAALVDPFGGAADLAAGVLRTPLGAAVSFTDDPLRMLRAARFVSGYDLTPTDDVIESMTALAERLEIVAVERRRDELDKLVMLEDPTAGLHLLEATGLAVHALPVESLDADAVGSRLAGLPQRLALRTAALFVSEPEHLPERLEALRLSKEARLAITRIVRGAEAALALDPELDPALRRLVLLASDQLSDALLLAAQLDPGGADQVSQKLDELAAREDLAAIHPPLTGAEVMVLLDLDEGPDVGVAVSHLLEMRLEEGPMTKESAAADLIAWWANQPRNSSTS